MRGVSEGCPLSTSPLLGGGGAAQSDAQRTWQALNPDCLR
jgi:hypothetical protein